MRKGWKPLIQLIGSNVEDDNSLPVRQTDRFTEVWKERGFEVSAGSSLGLPFKDVDDRFLLFSGYVLVASGGAHDFLLIMRGLNHDQTSSGTIEEKEVIKAENKRNGRFDNESRYTKRYQPRMVNDASDDKTYDISIFGKVGT